MNDLDRHVPAIAAGDADAFARWVAGAEPRLRASLRSFAGEVDVEAVLQEALLRTWQVAPRFEDDGRPDGLLRMTIRIARNLAVSELRRFRVPPARTEELARAAEGEPIPAAEPDPFLRRVLARCFEQLTRQPRRALQGRLEGEVRSDDEVAEELGMKTNTFLKNVGRARRALEACLERHDVRLAWERP